jgi:PncC family amidohydrolase
MALGARALYKSDIAISATGIAGPDGGSEEFPVGLVYIGVANQGGVRAYRYIFDGDRAAVRRQTVSKAIELMIAEAKKE